MMRPKILPKAKRPQVDVNVQPQTVTPGNDHLLSGLTPVSSQHESRYAENESLVSIVYCKSGNRYEVKEKVLADINVGDKLQFATTEFGVVFGRNCQNDFPVKRSGKKGIVYCLELLREIKDKFSLNFTHVTTISFHDVSYMDVEGEPVAFVRIRQEGQDADIQEEPVLPDADWDEASEDVSDFSDSCSYDAEEVPVGSPEPNED